MWDSLHTHTHHTINQIGTSQSPPLKSLTFSLGLTLCGSVSEPIRDYQAGSDTICNDPRKSASHICAIPQKDQSLLRLLVVVNKAQFNPVNTRCGTHHTPTHITQSIKLGYHRKVPAQSKILRRANQTPWKSKVQALLGTVDSIPMMAFAAIWLLDKKTRPQHSTDDVSKQGKNQWRAIVQRKYT